MSDVAVVYHSGYGHTEKVAKAIAEAIDEAGVSCTLVTAEDAEANLDQFDDTKTIVLGSPTYMGSASANMKSFMEASSKKWMEGAWRDKLAAGFSNSGSLSGDKLSTLMQFAVFAAQQQMLWISAGLDAVNKTEGHGGKPEDVNRIGSYLGLMTQSDNADPENTPAPGDMQSAKLFGQRIADITRRWAG